MLFHSLLLRRSLLPTLWVILALGAVSTPSDATCEVTWALYEPNCQPQVSAPAITFEAGDYGVFVINAPPILGCTLIDGCTESDIPIYPTPGPTPVDSMVQCIGSAGCYDDLQIVEDLQVPWIAAIDFPDQQGLPDTHGLMVQSVIKSAARSDTVVYLDTLQELALGPECESMNDADVLARLAALAEAIDHTGISDPTVVHMSFGRKHLLQDATDATCSRTSPNCSGSLGCQIARLLNHLERPNPQQPPRSTVVASRGNHGTALVPSVFAEVTSVGMLDLTTFARDRTIVPAAETPLGSDALMPGNGHCVNMVRNDPNATPFDIPGPAGSSLAAALYSGMLSVALLEDPDGALDALAAGPQWEPYQPCSANAGCPFVLRHNNDTFPTSSLGGSNRIYEIIGYGPDQCGNDKIRKVIQVTAIATQDEPLLHDSLIDLIGETHQKTPEPDPCVDCHLCCQLDQKNLTRPEPIPGKSSWRGSINKNQTTTINLTLDLRAGWYIPSELTLKNLYLRIGTEIVKLEILPPDLSRIANGDIDRIKIHGIVPLELDFSQQPSLVTVLDWQDATGTVTTVWDSTAIIWFYDHSL